MAVARQEGKGRMVEVAPEKTERSQQNPSHLSVAPLITSADADAQQPKSVQGVVILKKKNLNWNFTYTYFLTCQLP